MSYNVLETLVNDRRVRVGEVLVDNVSLDVAALIASQLAATHPGRRFVVTAPANGAIRQNCCSLDN